MITIEFEIPDELAEDVAPYKERLSELLALGLRAWKRNERSDSIDRLDALLVKLGEEERLILPQTEVINGQNTSRLAPISIPGTPISEVVSEQRAPK